MPNITNDNTGFYKSLFENSFSIMLIIHPESGRIYDANNAACNYYGYPKTQLLNMHIPEINTLSREEVLDEMHKAKSEKRKYFNFKHRLATGEIRDVEVFSNPIAIGEEKLLYSIVHDITDRLLAEAALKESVVRFRNLFENSADAIALIENGCFSDCNTSLLKMFGTENRSDFIGKTPDQLSPEVQPDGLKSKEKAQKMIELAFRNGSHRFEWVHMRMNGEHFWLDINLTKIFDKDKDVVHCIWRDITGFKQTEKDLIKINEALKRSNRDLQDFAYIASHDLKEPLRKITMMSNIVLNKYSDRMDNDGKDFLSRMQNAAKRMGILIDDLLQLSRLSTRAKSFTLVDLNVVVKEVLSDLEMNIKNSGAVFKIDKLPKLLADETQMQQLFQNIISNALKYKNINKTPQISIRCRTKITDDFLSHPYHQFTIEDNGIGFDQQYDEKIFMPFQRLHTRKEYPGTGIGLYLCKRIVERHGGNIHAEGSAANGAKFIFVLKSQ